ncbi:hypothetical protein COB11_01785 [Candidatus Aerophobetes bacterium]|uniref:Alpha/beta hydrolase n=1 Tax=Aerophobetes bacterium TaxID=2030807 RepID=A0A2A4YL93_UNCAE|nr:MAG: hypothetical protein COB11_01785 [Candidatus Aerophobetes bacterium]
MTSAIRHQPNFQGALHRVDNREYSTYFYDKTATFAAEVIKNASTFIERIKDKFSPNHYCHNLSNKVTWKNDSQGLYLLVHGVNGHPCTWSEYFPAINRIHKNVDIIAPYVPSRGNCALKGATSPILKLVNDYTQKNPGKPICLIGASNGSRIVASIETQIGTDVSVKVAAIAGPFFGSKKMDFAKSTMAASFLFTEAFVEELSYNSEFGKKLVKDMSREESPRNRYDFYVTKDDATVTPWQSGIPCLDKDETITVYTGVGHSGIVTAAKSDIVTRCTAWMKSH